MVWKPKEKELTPEEAVALAKKELSPYWHGSSPLLAGIKIGDAFSVHPLDASFNEHPWILFFVDPLSFSGIRTIHYLREFNHRYSSLGIRSLLILRPQYHFIGEPKQMEQMVRSHQIPCPVVIDADSFISQAFAVKDLPKVVLISKTKTIFGYSGDRWTERAEQAIHDFLRDSDPGLPLLPVYHPERSLFRNDTTIEMGRGRGTQFPAPGFVVGAGNFGAAQFQGTRPLSMNAKQLFIRGQWVQDGERIATSDSTAEIGFHAHCSEVALIAQSVSKTSESAKIVIEVNGIPVFDVFSGSDVTIDDEGQTVVRVDKPRLYSFLTKLTDKEREITLRFPQAHRASVAIYSIRFGEPVKESD